MSLLPHNPSRAFLWDSHPIFSARKGVALSSYGLRWRHAEVERFRKGCSIATSLGRLEGAKGQELKLGSARLHWKVVGSHQVRCLLPFISDEKRLRTCAFLEGLDGNLSSQRRRIHKEGRIYSRGKRRGMSSRKVKVGLMYKLIQFGRAGDNDGGDDNGHGWGGAGGGGDGGDGVSYNSDEGGFSFFSWLLYPLRDKGKSRVWVWSLLAFLAGYLVSSLELRGPAHAKAFSQTRRLAELTNGVENIEDAVIVGKEQEDDKERADAVWEVRGSKWKRFVVDWASDEFIFDLVKPSGEEADAYEQCSGKEAGIGETKTKAILDGKSVEVSLREAGVWASELVKQIFLPAGFPGSVTEGYMEFTSWRMGQIIASQISGVLTTQALLYAVGLGKGAIPTAAAVNWVLRDGIGYLSKIMLSKYGRHFDVHPKGWRLVSDLIENASYGLELLTPMVPHLFVYLAAAAGAGRSAAGMIQAATKSCFNANFAAQRNFAEIIAKGEAQGMASKSVGIGLGILISGYVGSQGPLLVVTFGAVSVLHIFFNLKSYQAVQLRTLNPYRASLVLAEYLKSGNVPTIEDVNAEEPIFFGVSWFNPKPRRNQIKFAASELDLYTLGHDIHPGVEGRMDTVSAQSKRVASAFEKNVELGVSLGAVVRTKAEADALMELYSKDKYLLVIQARDSIKVVLKEGASPRDMLRATVQAVYYLNSSGDRRNCSGDIVTDCRRGGILQVTHDLMKENFESITQVLSEAGWVSDGVLARAAPTRLLLEDERQEAVGECLIQQ